MDTSTLHSQKKSVEEAVHLTTLLCLDAALTELHEVWEEKTDSGLICEEKIFQGFTLEQKTFALLDTANRILKKSLKRTNRYAWRDATLFSILQYGTLLVDVEFSEIACAKPEEQKRWIQNPIFPNILWAERTAVILDFKQFLKNAAKAEQDEARQALQEWENYSTLKTRPKDSQGLTDYLADFYFEDRAWQYLEKFGAPNSRHQSARLKKMGIPWDYYKIAPPKEFPLLPSKTIARAGLDEIATITKTLLQKYAQEETQ